MEEGDALVSVARVAPEEKTAEEATEELVTKAEEGEKTEEDTQEKTEG